MKDLSKQYIKELIGHENPVILDIGCYDGKDSKEILEFFEKGTAHCFDPDPRSQQLWKRLNKENNKMILWGIALSNQNGFIDFYLSDSDTRRHYDFQTSWSASSSIRKPKFHKDLFPDVKFEERISVMSMTLDSWYQRSLKKVIDFAWVDVNGAEEDFVRGGLSTLEKIRYLYIETSDKECYEGEIKRNDLLKLLPSFEVMDIYKDEGNFGNVLLKNKNL